MSQDYDFDGLDSFFSKNEVDSKKLAETYSRLSSKIENMSLLIPFVYSMAIWFDDDYKHECKNNRSTYLYIMYIYAKIVLSPAERKKKYIDAIHRVNRMHPIMIRRNELSIDEFIGSIYDMVNDSVLDELMTVDLADFSNIVSNFNFKEEEMIDTLEIEMFLEQYHHCHMKLRIIYYMTSNIPMAQSNDFRADFIQRAEMFRPIFKTMFDFKSTFDVFILNNFSFEYGVEISLADRGYDFERDEYNLTTFTKEDYYKKANEMLELHFRDESETLYMMLDIREIQHYIYDYDYNKEDIDISTELWKDFKTFHRKFVDGIRYEYTELFIMNMLVGFTNQQN